MDFNFTTNNKKNNHLKCMKKIASKADTLIIVSPFVTDDFSKLIDEMKTIRKITLYTTLEKYADAADKAISLFEFSKYCKDNCIDLLIKIDDNLHGKVYLFYDGIKARGFVLTSGNFTVNGLVNNNEYGICVMDEVKQKELADIIMSINTYDLTYMQLCEIYDSAVKFLKKHPVIEPEKFKVNRLMNKKPSVTQNSAIKYFLKPVGTSQKPFMPPRVVEEHADMGFGGNPRSMHREDVLLLHSVGPSSIVGYYVVTSDEAVYNKVDDEDRWPWKVKVKCHSVKFSDCWWNYELKTASLVDEFLENNPGKHITAVGGDTLGGLQWGSDKLQITKEFAQFIISKIPG